MESMDQRRYDHIRRIVDKVSLVDYTTERRVGLVYDAFMSLLAETEPDLAEAAQYGVSRHVYMDSDGLAVELLKVNYPPEYPKV